MGTPRIRVYLWALFLTLSSVLGLSGCSITYYFAPIEGWVVDAESGSPIEGAVVMANWELAKGSFDGTDYFGQLEVRETVTDNVGRFSFEGFTKTDSSGAELRESDPQLIVFKSGYEYQRFRSHYFDGGAGIKLRERKSAISGKTIRLAPDGTDKDRLRQIHASLIFTGMSFLTQVSRHSKEVSNCYWQRIPRMLAETKAQERKLDALGVQASSIYDSLIFNSDALVAQAKVPCIAPKALLTQGAR